MTLASDYDGTLAHFGVVPAGTLSALRQFREAGNHLLLVTGRELDDLMSVFPAFALFHLIVAENGALLYEPAQRREQLLAAPPPAEFVNALTRRGVGPLYRGKVMLATTAFQEAAIHKTIAEMNLEFETILNLESVMILPRGVNKGSGLRVALQKYGIAREDTIAVGDAENDLDLFEAAGLGVAVANALPAVKARAAWITTEPRGEGVAELIERVLRGELLLSHGC